MRKSSTTSSASDDQTAEPLIGIEHIATPKWAAVDSKALEGNFWQAAKSLPASIKLVIQLAWQISPGLTLIAGFLHVASGCVVAFGLLATADVFTALLQQGPTPDRVMDSLPAISLVALSFAGRALLDTAVAAVEGKLKPLVSQSADNRIVSAIARADLIAFEDADFRELVRQGNQIGVRAIETTLDEIASIVSAGISVIAALATAGFLNPVLVPVLLLPAVADAWAAGRVARLNHQHFVDNVTNNMRSLVAEKATTRREFSLERHALTLQPRLISEYGRVTKKIAEEEIQLARRSNMVRLTGRTAAGVGTATAYVVLGLLLYTSAMELALAGTAALAMRTSTSSLSNLMRSVNQIYKDSFYVDVYQHAIAESEQRGMRRSTLIGPADPGEIRMEKVSFRYPGQDKLALKDVTVAIKRGEIVALVGENGSGKTTFGKLLTGLYTPDSGRVWWDDVDLTETDPSSTHQNIAVIAQNPAEWPMSAGNNVRVGRLDRQDSDGRAWTEAITKSGADEVLSALPYGEKTLLSKDFNEGQDLSGGQWQRMGIARGIYRDAHVLIADEPTAALDAKAEAKVFAGLQHATTTGQRRRTTILVTHRLANIKNADRIIVMDEGRIIEQGTHDELISQRGKYYELFEIQAAAYRGAATV